jgi:hypothetical protein
LTAKILNLQLQIKKSVKEEEKLLGDIEILKREQKILKDDLFVYYFKRAESLRKKSLTH